jgi:hypothetical protein
MLHMLTLAVVKSHVIQLATIQPNNSKPSDCQSRELPVPARPDLSGQVVERVAADKTVFRLTGDQRICRARVDSLPDHFQSP